MAAIGRWGDSRDLDYWTALACGEVDEPEQRAVDLLRRTTDEERFGYYCQTGMLPVMGNVTGRIYLLQRGGQAIELEDGRVVASWCISIGPHATEIPGTDHVVVLRNMVEGEELDFLEIGNRNPVRTAYRPTLLFGVQRIVEWLPDAYRESFGCDMGDAENEELLELGEIRASDWWERQQGAAPVEPIYGDDIQGYLPYDAIRDRVHAELGQYDAGEPVYRVVDGRAEIYVPNVGAIGVEEYLQRDQDLGPLEPADAAMEELAVTEEEIGDLENFEALAGQDGEEDTQPDGPYLRWLPGQPVGYP